MIRDSRIERIMMKLISVLSVEASIESARFHPHHEAKFSPPQKRETFQAFQLFIAQPQLPSEKSSPERTFSPDGSENELSSSNK